MHILLTGATGYIGKRLLPVLVANGYTVTCCVRDKSRFSYSQAIAQNINVVEVDFLKPETLANIPTDIDIAFYLIHSMASPGDYSEKEMASATNFRTTMEETSVRQVIYLSGIVNESELSKHLKSRLNVEEELAKGQYAMTTLRAGIIIGSGSASFEIIRDLVEKLPVMVAPRWLSTKCQPIAIKDVLTYLIGVIDNEACFNQSFDIGGPDILTYKDMLLGYARVRKLPRYILVVPVLTPRLSSYWLYFVTATSYQLAQSLVESMRVEVVCADDRIKKLIKTDNLSYEEAIERAFSRIKNDEIISSWKDSFISGGINFNLSDFAEVPTHGCFEDIKIRQLKDPEETINRIWQIGGNTGWYYASWLWKIRGLMDKLVGGVGLRRGRTHAQHINQGDAIDFWRVILADKESGRLLLFAEMKLPGEAWLEFKLAEDTLIQTATFRPRGIAGRLYWYLVLPFHFFVFNGMIRNVSV